jgi:hypothetical protein
MPSLRKAVNRSSGEDAVGVVHGQQADPARRAGATEEGCAVQVRRDDCGSREEEGA